MAWIRLVPKNLGGGRRATIKSARMTHDGQFSMSHLVSRSMLGSPDRVLVEVEPDKCQIRMVPTTPTDAGGFSLSGGGNSSARVYLRDALDRWPHLVGEYEPRKLASGVLFVKKEDE